MVIIPYPGDGLNSTPSIFFLEAQEYTNVSSYIFIPERS